MKNKDFFKKQSYLTSAKIRIFEEYIKGYLPKLLMTFNTCIIADLFSGAGKNGKNYGSPLVLINAINNILSSKHFSERELKIFILFNDQEKDNIENLKKELEKTKFDERRISITTKNEKYEEYIDELIIKLRDKKFKDSSKFIFLDPFTYSNIKMVDLQNLMNLPHTEVLLFIPIFHSYRFASSEFEKEHKTRKFIEEFTSKGIYNYKDVIEFMLSVREQLINKLSLKFVRPILLDGGGSKNSLFLLTKHPKGMLLMNKVIFKNSDDGLRLIVNNLNQDLLFKPEDASVYFNNFSTNLINKIKLDELTNKEIVDYTIEQGFLPRHAKKILENLYSENKIKVYDTYGNFITNKLKWNIAEKIRTETIFKWVK